MAEEHANGKPSLWNQALRAVKGDSTNALVEQFTQEMTLVAEGLCEDQARLRKAVEGLIEQGDKDRARMDQDNEALERQLDQQDRELRQKLDELSRRLDQLEKTKPRERRQKTKHGDLISRITLLAAIICGSWVLVTLVQAFL